MRELALTAWQVRYQQRGFWRNRRRAVFSLGFPLVFLLVFGTLTGDVGIDTRGGLAFIDFYVPGIVAYVVIMIGFNATAASIAALTSEGILKRVRMTPLPWGVYVAGTVGSTLVVMAAAVALMLAVGVLALGAHVRVETLPGLLATLALGCACFTTLGIAAARLLGKPEDGTGVLMLITMPLVFVSNVFFPLDEAPGWIGDVASAFPIRPLADGLQAAFDPRTGGAGFMTGDLAVLGIWTVLGCAMMVSHMRSLARRA